MVIYDRIADYMLADLYWLARSLEARRRYDRMRMRAFDIEAFKRFYTGVERIRPITFNPWAKIKIEEYVERRRALGEMEGLYEEMGWPYNL